MLRHRVDQTDIRVRNRRLHAHHTTRIVLRPLHRPLIQVETLHNHPRERRRPDHLGDGPRLAPVLAGKNHDLVAPQYLPLVPRKLTRQRLSPHSHGALLYDDDKLVGAVCIPLRRDRSVGKSALKDAAYRRLSLSLSLVTTATVENQRSV